VRTGSSTWGVRRGGVLLGGKRGADEEQGRSTGELRLWSSEGHDVGFGRLSGGGELHAGGEFHGKERRARSELGCRGARGAGARPTFIGREREGRRGGEKKASHGH
jgi:hypothetical protein